MRAIIPTERRLIISGISTDLSLFSGSVHGKLTTDLIGRSKPAFVNFVSVEFDSSVMRKFISNEIRVCAPVTKTKSPWWNISMVEADT